MSTKEKHYEDKPAMDITVKTALQGAGVGLLVSAVQNSLDKHNKGAMGVFTRTGGTIGLFAAMAGIFAGGEAISANVRQTDDAWNTAIGGCAAGFVAGLRLRSVPTMVFSCAAIGTLMGGYEYAGGGAFKGRVSSMSEEEKRKWKESHYRRRPVNMTTEASPPQAQA